MRTLPVVLLIALFATGCDRDSADLPDRGGHAWVRPGAAIVPTGDYGDVNQDPNPGPGETTIVLRDGERLYQVAERYQVGLGWLIRRNDFVSVPTSGARVIVPDRPGVGGAADDSLGGRL